MADIEKDIVESKTSYTCRVKLIDNQILATFEINNQTEYGSMGGWTTWDKIFSGEEAFQEFVEYLIDFSKEQLEAKSD